MDSCRKTLDGAAGALQGLSGIAGEAARGIPADRWSAPARFVAAGVRDRVSELNRYDVEQRRGIGRCRSPGPAFHLTGSAPARLRKSKKIPYEVLFVQAFTFHRNYTHLLEGEQKGR